MHDGHGHEPLFPIFNDFVTTFVNYLATPLDRMLSYSANCLFAFLLERLLYMFTQQTHVLFM